MMFAPVMLGVIVLNVHLYIALQCVASIGA